MLHIVTSCSTQTYIDAVRTVVLMAATESRTTARARDVALVHRVLGLEPVERHVEHRHHTSFSVTPFFRYYDSTKLLVFL